MSEQQRPASAGGLAATTFLDPLSWSAALWDYAVDATQRTILTLDVLRQRGNNYLAHNARKVPNVLSFEAELVVDARTLKRPVNYGLVRIRPPEGIVIDPSKRPFIVVDPRAGHGPGIGGMKHDSEIGFALRAGHPCYFVGFLPDPMPGQTIADVCDAEAFFVETVIARHPEANGKPALICNCQAGWQVMMMAATHPDLVGPIMLAGSPLSYWAGVRGKNPMRYLGGLLGGTWLTALAGDLGHGIFDGANLVANFESLHPDNTYWTKVYTVYSKVDTEAPRFLQFETYWGSPVLLNAEEMQSIADDLFVGNKLTEGLLQANDGTKIDLRNIASPIIVFCSHGDDITPPQQALGWILDLYASDEDIVDAGQTIIYSLHPSVGHLGIFVSGKVATKEHREFASCMDMIDLMPPGLYEAVITGVDETLAHPELISGKYLFTLEPRSIRDIAALGGNSPEDEARFATVARVSEINLGLYRTLATPAVRAGASEAGAEAMRRLQPNRLYFEMFADTNPTIGPVGSWAEAVRADRRPVAADNPFRALEAGVSEVMVGSLKAWGAARDAWSEALFLTVYGSPILQAAVGLAGEDAARSRRLARDLAREVAAQRMRTELESCIGAGGFREAWVRALMYVARPERRVDERLFAALVELNAALPPEDRVGFSEFKRIAREQFLILGLDEERAVAAIPTMLARAPEQPPQAIAASRRLATISGPLSEEARARLRRMEALFAAPARPPQEQASPQRKAS